MRFKERAMKKFKMLLVIVTAILCITSCKRSDADIIFKAQKNSNEKLISEWRNFADDFFMYKSTQSSGSAGYDFTITDFQSPKNEPLPEFMRLIITNKIGLKADFVDDTNKKEFRYSYKLKNILKGKPETDAVLFKISNTNIEAASPLLLQKTFTIKPSDVGKALALMVPQNFAALFNFSLSYDQLKKLQTLRLDKNTKKRLDKVTRTLYKKSNIQKNGDQYTIEMDAENLRQAQKDFFDILKNDSRVNALIELYKKILPEEEFSKLENQIKEALEKPVRGKAISELVIKNGLVEKTDYRYEYDNNQVIKVSAEIDYSNPLTHCIFTVSYPTEVKEIASLSFGLKGTYEKGKADITLFTNIVNQDGAEKLTMNVNFVADTSKSTDNFRTDISIVEAPDFGKSNTVDPIHVKEFFTNVTLSAVGNVQKKHNAIIYKVDNVLMNFQHEDKPAETMRIGTDATIYVNKETPVLFELPEEKLNVLSVKKEEWTALQNEIQQNLMLLQPQLNLQ